MEANLNELALFAGAGGGILGGKLLGWNTVCAVEYDAYAASVLVARQNDGCLEPFPIWDDVRTFDGKPWRGIVDVVSGGFPCTDISAAGKGAGITGKQSGLWTEMARIVGEVLPQFVFVENSPMLVGRGLAVVLGDLAEMGYDAEWGIVGAHHVSAPHKRDRIWIVAHSNGKRGCRRNTGREDAMDVDSSSEEWMHHAQAIRTDEGWECGSCRQDVFNGCPHYFGEWECEDCGEWTYPFYYEFKDGCQHCGGAKVRHAASSGLPNRVNRPMGEPGTEPESKRSDWWATEPDVGRVAHRVANRVDRLRCIGNGQVPAVAALAWNILNEK